MRPQISIGLPVFNGEKHIAQVLDSFLAQDFTDFELNISDNASTDRTGEICREYALKDQRIKYYRSSVNQGPTWNFNRVFELASADYFMWASHDDFWASSYLQACMDGFKKSDSIILSGTACNSIDADTSEIVLIDPGVTTVGLKPFARFRHYKESLHTGKSIHGILFGIFRKDALAKVMPLKNVIAWDHILLAELALSGEFYTYDRPFMMKRWGGASQNLKRAVEVHKISNPFTAILPYLITREAYLQRIIFKASQLNFMEKIGLSFWSLFNYLILFLRLRYRWIRDAIKSI